MKFTLDNGEGANTIKGFTPGKIKVNDHIFEHSLLVTATEIIPWKPESFSDLNLNNLEEIIAKRPEIVLVGTGEKQIFLPENFSKLFTDANIGLEVMTTLSACKTFDALVAEGRNVLAALLVR
jgi:uncharacterized protein